MIQIINEKLRMESHFPPDVFVKKDFMTMAQTNNVQLAIIVAKLVINQLNNIV